MIARESVIMALNAMRAQKLRSALTLLSVSIGVFAIIATSSITGTLENSMGGELARMGEFSFQIRRVPSVQIGGSGWRKYMNRKSITYDQALQLKERMALTDLVAISNGNPANTIKSASGETDPDVEVLGVDENFFRVNSDGLADGRQLHIQDVTLRNQVAIVGNDVVGKLFPGGQDPLGQTITIKNRQFEIVGVLTTEGGVIGRSRDNRVLIPMSVFDRYYTWEWDRSVKIGVRAVSGFSYSATIDEAIGIMRSLRGDKPGDDSSFETETNEVLSSQFAPMRTFIVYFTWFCSLGALLVAGIGIMNMMLVTVRERTREIGVRLAVGAQRKWIVRQFLIEAVTICQIGAIIGVASGLLVSWLITVLLEQGGSGNLTYVIPWNAVLSSVIICTFIGLVFGVYPARRAARLDPVEALRYE